MWQFYAIQYSISSLKFCILLLCIMKKIQFFTKSQRDTPKYPQLFPSYIDSIIFYVSYVEKGRKLEKARVKNKGDELQAKK